MNQRRLSRWALRVVFSIAWLGSVSAQANAKFALLAGGSGEDGDDSFLVHDLRDLSARLTSRGWTVRVAAGPRDGLIPAASPSLKGTNANVRSALHEITDAAKSGDELLVLLHSHGRARETEWGQRSHSIVSEDKDPSGSEPGLDLDSLGPVLDRAAARGVYVALVDLSCYSGSTQTLLKSPASCTAPLAAPNYVSFCSGRPEERHFSSRFLALPKTGTPISLEEQFLNARRTDLDSINLPEISSRTIPALKEWDEMLTAVDPLDVFEDLKNYRAGPKPFEPAHLLSAIHKESASPRALSLLAEVKTRLTALLATRAKLESAVDGMAHSFDDDSLELKLPDREPFKISPGNLSDLLEQTEKADNPEGYSDVQRSLIATLRPLRSSTALTRLAKPLADFRARKSHFEADVEALADDAGKLLNVERELYDILSRPVPDPASAKACRVFAL